MADKFKLTHAQEILLKIAAVTGTWSPDKFIGKVIQDCEKLCDLSLMKRESDLESMNYKITTTGRIYLSSLLSTKQ